MLSNSPVMLYREHRRRAGCAHQPRLHLLRTSGQRSGRPGIDPALSRRRANRQKVGRQLEAGLARLASHPLVGDTRASGMLGAVETVRNKTTKAAFDPALKMSERLFQHGIDNGIVFRAFADGTIGSGPRRCRARRQRWNCCWRACEKHWTKCWMSRKSGARSADRRDKSLFGRAARAHGSAEFAEQGPLSHCLRSLTISTSRSWPNCKNGRASPTSIWWMRSGRRRGLA